LEACLVAEVVLTFMFLMIILGSTDKRAPQGLAPIAIGLGLTLIHLIGIPVTNTSVNPARSTGPAIIVGGWALQQLWLFWVAPIVGAALAGLAYPMIAGSGEPAQECKRGEEQGGVGGWWAKRLPLLEIASEIFEGALEFRDVVLPAPRCARGLRCRVLKAWSPPLRPVRHRRRGVVPSCSLYPGWRGSCFTNPISASRCSVFSTDSRSSNV
jgi:hypothetical protein